MNSLILIICSFASSLIPSYTEGYNHTSIINSSPIRLINIAELPAVFPGCDGINRESLERKVCYEELLHNFIYDNLKYPKKALRDGIQGTVVVLFEVENDGNLSNFRFGLEKDEDLDEEAMRIARSMPNWLPAQVNGENISSTASIAVRFSIQNKTFARPKFVAPVKPEYMYKITAAPSDEVFKVVETVPMFPGCEYSEDKSERKICSVDKMLQFIYSNLIYPEDAKKDGIEGTIYLKFVVEKDGTITSPEIVRGIGGGCDEEALRIVGLMPKWVPGFQRDKVVRVQFNLPMKFKLP